MLIGSHRNGAQRPKGIGGHVAHSETAGTLGRKAFATLAFSFTQGSPSLEAENPAVELRME